MGQTEFDLDRPTMASLPLAISFTRRVFSSAAL
jgi:hypothetical protein